MPTPTPSPPPEAVALGEAQLARLDKLQTAAGADLARIAEDARRRLREALDAAWTGDTVTPLDVVRGLAVVETVARDLEAQAAAALAVRRRQAREQAIGDILAALALFLPAPTVAQAGGLVAAWNGAAPDAVTVGDRLPTGLGSDLVRAARPMIVGAARLQLSPAQAVRQIAGPTALRRLTATARTIGDVQVGAAHAQLVQVAGDEIARQLPLPVRLWKLAIERIDNRNHPISRVLHLQQVPFDADFTAAEAEVAAVARSMGRPYGGIYWPRVRGVYRGTTYPAHVGERGVVVPIAAPRSQAGANRSTE